ncbi:MAG: septation regulator SpoVG [Thermodesulfobacteriota bacterium]
MEITDVRVSLAKEEKLRAFVTITIDNCFIIRDLKIINGQNGLFVAMPSRKRKDGTFMDIAHPLNKDTRDILETRVLAEYEKELDREEVGSSFFTVDTDTDVGQDIGSEDI